MSDNSVNNKEDWDSFFINPHVYQFLDDSLQKWKDGSAQMIVFASEEGMGKRFYIRKLQDQYKDEYESFFFRYSLERICDPLYPFLPIIKKKLPRREDFSGFIKQKKLNETHFNWFMQKLYEDAELGFFEYSKVSIRRNFFFTLLCEVLNRLAEDEPFLVFLSNLQRASASTLDFINHINNSEENCKFLVIATYNEDLLKKEKQLLCDNLPQFMNDMRNNERVLYIKLNEYEIEMFSKFYQHFGLKTDEILELFSTTGSNIFYSKNLYNRMKQGKVQNPGLEHILKERLESLPEEMVENIYFYYMVGIFDLRFYDRKFASLDDEYSAFSELYYQKTTFNFETDISNSTFISVVRSFLPSRSKLAVYSRILDLVEKLEFQNRAFLMIYLQSLIMKEKKSDILVNIEDSFLIVMRYSFACYAFYENKLVTNIIIDLKDKFKRSFKGEYNIRLMLYIGASQFFLGHYNESMKTYLSLLDSIKERDFNNRIEVLLRIANIYETREEFRQMLDWYQKAQMYSREHFSPYHEALCHYKIGIFASKIGTIFSKGPEYYFEEAVALIKEYSIENLDFVYDVYSEYTTALFLIWNYNEAHRYMKVLKKMVTRDIDPFLLFKVDKIQGDYFSSIGKWREATRHYLKAVEKSVALSDNRITVYLYNAAGYCNYNHYNFRKGLEYYYQAFLYMPDDIEEAEIGLTCDNIGELLYRSGLYEQAIEYLGRAQYFKELSSRWIKVTGFYSEIKTQILMGICYVKMGIINRAEECYNRVKDEKGSAVIVHHKVHILLLKALISAYYQQNRDAEREFDELVEFIGAPDEMYVIEKKQLLDIYKEIENYYVTSDNKERLSKTRDVIAQLEKDIDINTNEKNQMADNLVKLIQKYEKKIDFDQFIKRIEQHSMRRIQRYRTNDYDLLIHLSNELIKQIEYSQIYQVMTSIIHDYFPWSGVCIIEDYQKGEDIKIPACSNLGDDFFDDSFFKTVVHHYLPSTEIVIADHLEMLRDNSMQFAPFLTAIFIPFESAHKSVNHIVIFQFNDDAQFGALNNSFLKLVANICSISIQNSMLFKRTEELAIYDRITNLYTRTFFNIKLDETIELSRRYNYKFGLMLIDINRFTFYNERYGFSLGDKILQYVGEKIHYSFRINDVSARLETDMFGIIIPFVNEDILDTLYQRLIKNINDDPFYFENSEGFEKTIPVTITAGAAIFPTHGKNKEILYDNIVSTILNADKDGENSYILAENEPEEF
jgi:diguanylate cyclase (GGDEF)-like protein